MNRIETKHANWMVEKWDRLDADSESTQLETNPPDEIGGKTNT